MKKERTERILREMEHKGLTQMIVCDPYSVFYLTGRWIFPGERLLAFILKTEGQHELVVSRLYPQAPDADFHVSYFDDCDDYMGLLCSHLDRSKTIGVEKTWQAKFLLRLLELFPETGVVNASAIVDYARMVKDAEEQELLRKASLLNDETMARILKEANSGLSEQALADRILAIYNELGASGPSFSPIVAMGKNSADPHYMPQDAVPQYGDCITFDIGCVLNNYCSDMTRDVFIGTVSDKQREAYEIVKEANLRGIEAAKPGNRKCDVDLAARGVIERAGYGEFFVHRTGHSCGLEDHEFGDVSSQNTDIIKPGECFSVEPGIYLPHEGFGVRVEDLVITTENGCEVLNHYPKDITVLPFEG
ncbi:MAG: Xaa-Pro peptidase family protein [Eubacteriales bacterium]|nr:Xaa-Pro peptidase family protein [Eubacteriales bacterium]